MPCGVYDRTKAKPNEGWFKKGYPKPKNAYVFPKGKNNPRYGVNSSGQNNPTWKGGVTYINGYKYILKPKHPFCQHKGYLKYSRFIMEQHIGRYLRPEEKVHHINGIKTDDRIENLKLFPNESEHQKFHNAKKSMKHQTLLHAL